MNEQADAFWLDRPVLITGCTGLLGSWMTIALAEAGAQVVGLIRDEVPHSHLRRSGYQARITTVRGDVTDYTLVERTLNEYEIETVLHLAAQTIVTIANRAPLSTFDTNVRGTWTVLEAARHSPTVGRLIVASSDKAYGAQTTLPYTEDMALRACHPYDVSKACADLIGHAYAATYGLPVAITRCANLFGGGDLNWNRIVPGTIRSALRGEPPLIRSDGSPQRDYLYVQDAVRAYLMLAEQLDRPEVQGQAFNFGTDRPRTVLEMVETIIALSNHPDLKPVVLGEASNEIQDQYLDSSKAVEHLDWRPTYTLREGLRRTMAWYRAFLTDRAP
jgi:CDP-glucose 4,6-dehydratase